MKGRDLEGGKGGRWRRREKECKKRKVKSKGRRWRRRRGKECKESKAKGRSRKVKEVEREGKAR